MITDHAAKNPYPSACESGRVGGMTKATPVPAREQLSTMLKQARMSACMTRRTLAGEMGVSEATIRSFETGVRCPNALMFVGILAKTRAPYELVTEMVAVGARVTP